MGLQMKGKEAMSSNAGRPFGSCKEVKKRQVGEDGSNMMGRMGWVGCDGSDVMGRM
jgi:hypothetical protein